MTNRYERWLFLPLLAALPAVAQADTFVDRAAFDAAVAGLSAGVANETFDGFDDGFLLPSGSTVATTDLIYDFGGVTMEVRAIGDPSEFDTTTPPNYLGTDDAGIFQDGDDILFSFSSGGVNAIGLSITTADDMQLGDVKLITDADSASLDPDAVQQILTDGARVYFVGIVNARSFATAQLLTNGGGFFLHTLEDLSIATAPDGDGDGIADAGDNCTLAPNPNQIDSDGDNIGNRCDPDIALPNNCLVNIADLAVLRAAFFATPADPEWNPDADFITNGLINIADLAVMRAAFLGPPGPSGLPNPCGP